MAEAVWRQHRRTKDRWLPKEARWSARAQAARMVGFACRAAPGYLLAFAEVLGIPSGLQLALGSAMAALGMDVRPVLAGSAAAMLARLLCGLPPRWELLPGLALLAVAPLLLHGRKNGAMMAFTGLMMLPAVVAAGFASTAAEMLQGWGAAAMAVLSAPVMARALRALKSGKHLGSMEERISVGYLSAMCLCGGARMLLGCNIGMLMAAGLTLGMTMALGVGAGVLTGLLSGVVLALQGLPLTVSVALAMGGFLAGVAHSLSRRKLTCGAFAMGTFLPMLLCGGAGFGCGLAIWGASAAMALIPREPVERLLGLLRRFLPNDPVPGDAYAAASLSAWEQTIAALARAVPSPADAQEERSGSWWQSRLCQGCPECERCGCVDTELGVGKAEAVWAYRSAHEEVWQGALEQLRGMGCQRLYYLLDSMNALRREDEAAQRSMRQAEAQREMLVTHLLAMSGAARRFAMLSAGESWWDDMAARRIRHLLADRAMPASLSYVRRVQGHAQAAFELEFITGARKQSEELCQLAAAVLDAPMQLTRLDGDRVLLTEQPLLQAEVGVAAEAITGGEVCGDTAWSGMLQDGRFMAALSDGMGHGERAALSSRQTVELLRLCLDAGYSRQQTLTAVNGMMLLGGDGERFATADVLTIDLWKGHAALDKLGAAASWLYQQGVLTRLTGDGLPLGILEEIDLSGNTLKLSAGDVLILLTDGVEDAFRSVSALEEAILTALGAASPKDSAEALLQAAMDADEGQRRDDQSAVFVSISSARRQALQNAGDGVSSMSVKI